MGDDEIHSSLTVYLRIFAPFHICIFLCWTFAFASPVFCLSSKIYLLSSFHFKISYNIYTPLYIPEKQVELHPSFQNLVTSQMSFLDFVLCLSPSVLRIS